MTWLAISAGIAVVLIVLAALVLRFLRKGIRGMDK